MEKLSPAAIEQCQQKTQTNYKEQRDQSFELNLLQERRIAVLKDQVKELERQNAYLSKRFTQYWGQIEMRD